jgi:hypothetical protein
MFLWSYVGLEKGPEGIYFFDSLGGGTQSRGLPWKVVPEPISALLALTGMMALVAVWRRR